MCCTQRRSLKEIANTEAVEKKKEKLKEKAIYRGRFEILLSVLEEEEEEQLIRSVFK